LGGKPICVLTTKNISFNQESLGALYCVLGQLISLEAQKQGQNGEVIACINPGGEETWDRLVSAHSSPGGPFIVLNNAYSTTYGLGNNRGFEEVYYVMRILKGWAFLSFFPGPWRAYLEKPDGNVEL
jgi:hypothetical protein